MGSYQFGGSESYVKGEMKRKQNEKIKIWIISIITLAIILAITFGYFAMRSKLQDSVNSGYGNADTLEADVLGATALKVNGSYNDLNMHAGLWADGEQIGGLTEKGAFDMTVEIAAGGKVVYTIADDSKVTDEMNVRCYVFKDAAGTVLGYAAENYPGGGYMILDADKNDTGYAVGKDGEWLYSHNGVKDVVNDYWPGTWNYYEIAADFSHTDAPAIVRIFMLYKSYNYGYSYHSSHVS